MYRCQVLCEAAESDLTRVWIRSCFAWDNHHLASMCRWCEVQPTKGLKTGSKCSRPIMQRALLAHGWRVIENALKRIEKSRAVTQVEPERPVREEKEFVILCMGMWWKRGARKVHPDTARLDQLERMVVPGVRVVADTLAGVQVVASDKQLLFDISRAGTWSGTDPARSITGEVAHLIIMDYFYLPKIYLEAENKQGLGYGGDWVTKVTFFFSNGGHLALLPNDQFGSMERSLRENPVPWCCKLDVADTRVLHPLYMATDAITDGGFLVSVTDHLHRGRTNDTSLREYLDEEQPFLLFYSPDLYDSHEAARAKLRALMLAAPAPLHS